MQFPSRILISEKRLLQCTSEIHQTTLLVQYRLINVIYRQVFAINFHRRLESIDIVPLLSYIYPVLSFIKVSLWESMHMNAFLPHSNFFLCYYLRKGVIFNRISDALNPDVPLLCTWGRHSKNKISIRESFKRNNGFFPQNLKKGVFWLFYSVLYSLLYSLFYSLFYRLFYSLFYSIVYSLVYSLFNYSPKVLVI